MASYMGHEYTPAPATQGQGRYRVGDRVRVVKDGFEPGGSYHSAKVGDVDEIVAIDTSDDSPFEGNHWYYKEHEISPAFRPGDRVKLNKHSGMRACGERGTVSAVLGDNVSVRMDDASVYGTVVAFFHADNLDWERVEDCPVKPERKDEQGVTLRDILGDALARDGGFDCEDSLELVTAAPCPQDNEQPCIVARIEYFEKAPWGSKPIKQPLPAGRPHVHPDSASAIAEAERLARNNPGQEFAVYQRVTARVAEVQMKEVA